MKRKTKLNRMAAFLAAMLLTVFSLCQAAFAADTNVTVSEDANIDMDRPMSLNITIVRNTGNTTEVATDKVVTLRLYQVGEWDSSQSKYVMTEAFANSGVVLDLDKAGDIQEETEALKKYATDKNITPLTEGRTKDGKYSFTDLSMGLYMVWTPNEEEVKSFGDNAQMFSFLVTLPLWIDDEEANISGWVYDVNTSSKYREPDAPEPDNPPGGNNPSGNTPGGGGPGRDRTPDRGVPGTPGGGTPIDDEGTPLGQGENPPLENIDDESVPLSDNPFQQIIDDVLVPLGLLPKTGDGSISYAPLLALMGASGLLIFALIRRRIKKAH